MVVITNVNLYDFVDYRSDMYVVFDSTIKEIGKMPDFDQRRFQRDEIINMDGKLLMPPFLNGHTHIYSTFARGINLPFAPKNFMDILTQLWWKIDRELDSGTLHDSALMYGVESIKNGVGYIIDHNASGKCIKGSSEILKRVICDRLGLKGLFCFETSDRFPIEECIDENISFSKDSGDNSRGLFGMHASLSLSDSSLDKIRDKIEDIPIHVHLGESRDDLLHCKENYGVGLVERLEGFNLINPDSLLVHCVHLSDEELDDLKEKNVTISVNINSNMNNSVGVPKVKNMLDRGLKVIVGTDGLGSNVSFEYITLVNSCKHIGESPTSFDLSDMKKIIRNGYEYISRILNRDLGRIRVGSSADFQSYDYKPFTRITEDNILAHIFYGIFYNENPKDLFMDGRWIMKSGNIFGFDSVEYEECMESSSRLWEKIKGSEHNA